MEAMRPALILFLFACSTLTGCSDRPGATSGQSTPANSSEPKNAAVTRYEFSLAVMGRMPDEVTAAIGKPERTSESEGRTIWHYSKRTLHPQTGEIDPSVQVVFKNGVVVDVLF